MAGPWVGLSAVHWALTGAPNVPPKAVAVLVGLAMHAGHDGRGTYPTVQTLAVYARKSTRAVQDDLRDLERAGVIRRGDQAIVAHLRGDRRPTVWDLAMEARGEADLTPHGVKQTAPRGSHGVKQTAPRGEAGFVQNNPEEPTNPSVVSLGGRGLGEGGAFAPPLAVGSAVVPLAVAAAPAQTTPPADESEAIPRTEESQEPPQPVARPQAVPTGPSLVLAGQSGWLIGRPHPVSPTGRIQPPKVDHHPYRDDGRGCCERCGLIEGNRRHREVAHAAVA